MSLIPDIPKDFEKWAFTDAVPQYMYYEYGKRIGLCTCCGKHHELKEQPKYGKEGTCPGCKRKVQYRTYKKKRPDTRLGVCSIDTENPGRIRAEVLCFEPVDRTGDKKLWRNVQKSASPTMNNGTGRRFILTTDIRRQIKSDGAMDMST